MSKRFRNAIAAQGGACNALALSNALTDAIREVRAENASERDCAACKLIAHQLSFLLNVATLELEPNAYTAAMTRCEEYVAGAAAFERGAMIPDRDTASESFRDGFMTAACRRFQ
jgi:hypothetical protein